MSAGTRRLPPYAWVGVALLVLGEYGVFAPVEALSRWTTPICWWGYILLADAVLKRVAGWSMLCDRPRVLPRLGAPVDRVLGAL